MTWLARTRLSIVVATGAHRSDRNNEDCRESSCWQQRQKQIPRGLEPAVRSDHHDPGLPGNAPRCS